MHIAAEHDKISFGPYDWDFKHLTFFVLVFNGIFYAIQKYGTDQSIVQRYLAARTDRDAKKASLMGILMSVPAWALFMFVGTCLFAYYQINRGAACRHQARRGVSPLHSHRDARGYHGIHHCRSSGGCYIEP